MEQLKQYLTKNKISQTMFADELGISYGFLSLMLSGKRTPGLHLAVQIEALTKRKVKPSDWILD